MAGDTPDWSSLAAYTNDLLVLASSSTGNPLAGGAVADAPASQYGSLVVVCNSGSAQYLKLDFHQAATPGGVGDTVQYTEYLTNIDPAVTPEWLVPINAGSVRITNLSGAAVNLIVYGSTRVAARVQLLGYTTLTRLFSYTGATVANTPIVIPAADGQANSTQLHGQLYVRASSSSIAGLFGFRYIGQDGVPRVHYQGQFAAGSSFWGFVTHPAVPVQWIILPTTTVASTVLAIELTQVGP